MKLIQLENSRNNKGHYSAGVLSGNLLFISGMLSVDPITRIPCKGGIKEHTKMALENVKSVLDATSLSKNNIVQCRIYISDIAFWDDVNEVFSQFFEQHKPARVIVPVTELHFGCLVEIEAIAEVN